MIRSRFVVALVLLFSVVSFKAARAETSVGVISGFSFSNLRIEGQSGLQGRSSFAAGGVVDFGINERFGIRIEPTWLSKGTKATNRNAYWNTMDGVIFQLDYIDIPVLARYNLQEAAQHAYLLGGLSGSIATQLEAKLTQGQASETVDMSSVLKSYDVSLDLGAGFSFAVGSNGQRLNIDGRAAIGLININDGGAVTFQGAPLAVPATSTKTIDFRLFASYLFPL